MGKQDFKRPAPAAQEAPEAAFFTPTTEKKAEPTRNRYNRFGGENKAKRVTIAVRPSIYEALQRRSMVEKRSPNALINDILEEALKDYED